MPFSRRDLLALLMVLGAAVAGVVVWDYGKVDVGMSLTSDGQMVSVHDVTPDGNAARNSISPGMTVLNLTLTDGGQGERAEPIRSEIEYGETYQPPLEAVDSARIDEITVGQVESEGGVAYATAYSMSGLDRGYLEHMLQQTIWLAALGVGLGALVWRLLVHGIAGPIGREHAVMLGAAVAVPFAMLPVVQVGNPIGIAAAYFLPAALALLIGLSLARHAPDRQWVQTAMAGALVAAAMLAVFVVRSMSQAALDANGRGQIFVLMAAITVAPAAVAALAQTRTVRQRAGLLSIALLPVAALTLIGPNMPEPWWPLILLTGLLGWQLLPVGKAFAIVTAGLGRVRSQGPTASIPNEPAISAMRDRLTYGLIGVAVLMGVTLESTWSVLIGIALAAVVGFAVRRGFLGADWTDAAVPLAAATGVPIILYLFSWPDFYGVNFVNSIPTALAALSVAHLLAGRHTDPVLRWRLFLASVALVGLIVVLSLASVSIAIPLIGIVALIPGFPTAFADVPGEPRAVSSRLETLAVSLTPGAAATVLVPSLSWILLAAWLVAVVVWRQFTLTPLLGMAQRTQLQRDVAVAAAETERARLAADLHDDALQQLTMLVRTLDESGQKDAAAEAREVATKLRSIVGDLRLPILDDLGAGAALEWLVERVEPLAGGPVKLERSDASRPPANVELAIFRVAQEALTNAIKHGKTPIAVRYDVNADGRVTLAIDDAGPGIAAQAAEEAPQEGHFGLLNMQQRAEQIGALLDVRRWPAGGTRVALEWRPQTS